MPRLRHSFLYNAAYQILLILTPLITTPYLSRVLEPEGVGLFSWTSSITQYFVLFAALGMSTYGVRLVASVRDNRKELSRVFWSAFFSQLTISLLVLGVYIFYLSLDPKGGVPIALFWGLWVLSAALNLSWLLFGIEEFRIPTLRNVVVKIAELACVFLFVRQPSDLWIYVLIIAGGSLISQLLIWPFVGRYVDFYRPRWKEIHPHFAPSFKLFIPVVAISLYTVLDKIMLGSMSDMSQAGFFEYSERVVKIPLAVITAFGAVMLPRMSSYFANDDRETGMHLLEVSFWFMMIGSFAAAFGIGSIAPEFIPKFLSGTFNPAIPTMMLLSAIIPLIAATNVIGNQYLLPTHQDRFFTMSVITGAIVNIVLNLLLIPHFAAFGAAIATVAAESAVLIAQMWVARQQLPLAHLILKVLPYLIIGAVMAGIVRYIAYVTRAMWGLSYTGLFLEVAIGAIFYLGCTFAWLYIRQDSFFTELFHSSIFRRGKE